MSLSNYMRKLETAIFNVSFRVLAKERIREDDIERLNKAFGLVRQTIKSNKGIRNV